MDQGSKSYDSVVVRTWYCRHKRMKIDIELLLCVNDLCTVCMVWFCFFFVTRFKYLARKSSGICLAGLIVFPTMVVLYHRTPNFVVFPIPIFCLEHSTAYS